MSRPRTASVAVVTVLGMVLLVPLVVLGYLLEGRWAFGPLVVYLLTLIFSYGAIALLVVFAPELRAALAQIGRSPMSQVASADR